MKTGNPIPTLPPEGFVRQFFKPSIHEAVTLYPGAAAEAPQAMRWGIHRVEEVVRHIRFPIPPLRNLHYEFLFLRSGSGSRTDGLNRYDIGPGRVYLTAPGQIVSSEGCSPDATGFYCFFYGDVVLTALQNARFLDELPFFQVGNSPLVHLTTEVLPILENLLTQLEAEFLNPGPEHSALTSALFQAILVYLRRCHASEINPATPNSAATLTVRFKNALAQQVLTLRSVSEYADQLAVTPNHLNRCVRATTGRTASDLITDMLILEAKVRLRQTSLSVAEIAAQLGFDDGSYFSRVFRKHVGVPPLDYRQSG